MLWGTKKVQKNAFWCLKNKNKVFMRQDFVLRDIEEQSMQATTACVMCCSKQNEKNTQRWDKCITLEQQALNQFPANAKKKRWVQKKTQKKGIFWI